jgi:hypothetical protein
MNIQITDLVKKAKEKIMNKNVLISTGALGALLLLGVMGPHGAAQFPSTSGGAVKETAGTNLANVAAGNAISVDSQAAGNSVTISSVKLEKKGFVVIHEKDNELLGKILGSSALLDAGESNNVAITLREPLEEAETYLAVLVVDNGDGRYMPGIDHPVVSSTDANGGPLKVDFSAD